jgi:methyl-accepting chemotaxis protein
MTNGKVKAATGKMTFHRALAKAKGRLGLTIRQKMLVMAVWSLGTIALLAGMNLQLSANIAEQMQLSDQQRQIRDSLAAMRTSVLQSELVAKDAIGSKADFTKNNLADLTLSRKDFEREFKKVGDFLRDKSKALGNRDAQREFGEINDLLEKRIRPALQSGKAEGLAAAAAEYGDRASDLNEMLESLADVATAELRKHFAATETEIRDSRYFDIAMFGGALVILLPLFFVTTISILRPLRRLTRIMQDLASGSTAMAIPEGKRRDEIGAMALTVEVFRSNTEKMHDLERERVETQERAAVERRALMDELATRLDAKTRDMIATITTESAKLRDFAATMTIVADATHERSATASATSQESTGNVKAVAAAEELSASIQEMARQIERSATITRKAVDGIEATAKDVEGVAETASRINHVVKFIEDIASKTNLLALNATIEAARAGEAGKGFAVVASEVKSLATQAAKATEDIGTQIRELHAVVGRSVASMGEVRSVVLEADGIAATVAGAIRQQGAATDEIARNVVAAAAGNEAVSAAIEALEGSAGEGQRAAASVHTTSEVLAGASASLGDDLRALLDQVRAA